MYSRRRYYESLLRRVAYLESMIIEGKRDQEILNNFLGDEYYSKFTAIKDKIKDPEYKDIYKLIKKDPNEVKDYIDNFQSKSDIRRDDKKGASKVYEDDKWTVYKITTYPAAQLYGKGTKWCITGRYPGHEGKGEKYFNNYIKDNNLDGGYYFYIKNDGKTKFALLRKESGEVLPLWNAADEPIQPQYILDEDPDFPSINGIFNPPSPDSYGLYSRQFYDVKNAVDEGQDVNQVCDNRQLIYYGLTPLDWQMKDYRINIAEYLIDNGAKITPKFEWKNLFNWSDYALFKKCVNRGLLNIVSIPEMFEYVLQKASSDWIKLVLNLGADPSKLLPCGKYPLQVELENTLVGARLGVIRELLKRGADPNITCDDGRSLIELATDNNVKPVIIKLLAQVTNTVLPEEAPVDPSVQLEADREKIEKALKKRFSRGDFDLKVYTGKDNRSGDIIIVDLRSKYEWIGNGAHKVYAISKVGSQIYVSEMINGNVRSPFDTTKSMTGLCDIIMDHFFS